MTARRTSTRAGHDTRGHRVASNAGRVAGASRDAAFLVRVAQQRGGWACKSSTRRSTCGARVRWCRRTARHPICSMKRCATWMRQACTAPSSIRPAGTRNSHALAIEACRLHGERFAILGRIPLDQPQRRAEIETWRQQPGMVGLRYTFLQPHMKSWPSDGTMDWLWPAAERLGLPVALLAGEFLPLIGRIGERHPGLRLIVDHFGVARGNKDDAAVVPMPQLLALAKHPNIALKVTGGPQYVTDPYPFRSLQPRYKAIYDAFGPERMFWGTDITRMPCTWRECVTAFAEHQPWLSERDKSLIMGQA